MMAIWNFILALLGIYVRPGVGTWKGCLFIPHKIYGVGGTPIWPGNRGVDSMMTVAYDAAKNEPWQAAKRTNWMKWAQSYGGDAGYIIAEPMFNNPAVLKLFSDEKGAFIQEMRKYGIKRLVVGLFNDGPLMSVANREAHIKAVCAAYSWASVHEVMYLTCLESEKNMTASDVRQIIGWLRQYGGGKRIAVGSPKEDYLRAASRMGAEMWAECDEFPFFITMRTAQNYLSKMHRLQDFGEVIAGEWGAGQSGELDKYLTGEAMALGMDCGSGYYK